MKIFVKIALPMLLIAGLLLAGCATKAPTSVPATPPAPAPAPSSPLFVTPQSRGTDQGSSNFAASNAADDTSRKIVKTASMTLEVDDIVKTTDRIAQLASDLNGYVVSSNRSDTDERNSGRVSIRVPAQRFNEAIDKLRGLAVKVPYENTASQDVTEQYTDLKAQLKNLEATEVRYLELLKKADTVKDIIEVQRELSNIQGQIERLKGRIQYLERTSDISLIEINLQQTKAVGEGGWDALQTLKSALNGLVVFGKILANIVIWLLIFSPVWIIILVIVFLVRRRKKAKARA